LRENLTLTLPRIYSSRTLQNVSSCELGADNRRYLKTVLRLNPGDRVIIFDGYGHNFEARIASFTSSGVCVALEKALPHTSKHISITLAQALPKGNKMDLIVKGVAELGADVIIPFTADRSVSRLAGEKAPARVVRWQKIAREASRCTGSASVAEVEPVVSFEGMLLRAQSDARKMIFWEEEKRLTIKDALSDPAYDIALRYFIVVGPEGGLSRDEVAQARQAGFIPVTLGRQILKVETAAMAILAIIQYEKGIFGLQSERGAK